MKSAPPHTLRSTDGDGAGTPPRHPFRQTSNTPRLRLRPAILDPIALRRAHRPRSIDDAYRQADLPNYIKHTARNRASDHQHRCGLTTGLVLEPSGSMCATRADFPRARRCQRANQVSEALGDRRPWRLPPRGDTLSLSFDRRTASLPDIKGWRFESALCCRRFAARLLSADHGQAGRTATTAKPPQLGRGYQAEAKRMMARQRVGFTHAGTPQRPTPRRAEPWAVTTKRR